MSKRHHLLPSLWLMTDERLGDALLPAVRGMPRGAGIIFRHYATPAKERRRLFDDVRAMARRRGLVLLLAGTPRQARAWKADGAHGRHHGALTAPAHDAMELHRAQAAGARLILLSPVHATRSHPGAAVLGPVRFGLLARQARVPIIALGGMTSQKFGAIARLGAAGWAGIDGLAARVGPSRRQKRKAVPR
jgi:thiamine-phosphate pyrophosphorylase